MWRNCGKRAKRRSRSGLTCKIRQRHRRLIERAVAELGPLDLLVNNASVFQGDSAERFDAEAFDAHFAVHVRAPSILAADFARQLPEGVPGLIVNIIDQRVWALNPRFYSYTLSKSALWTATQTMAQSLRRASASTPSVRVRRCRSVAADGGGLSGADRRADPEGCARARRIRPDDPLSF